MDQYVAFLRGINVSGQKIIKMDDLKNVLIKNGLKNVSTYIQSGNILFEHEQVGKTTIEDKIKGAINKHYGFEVEVLVLSISDLKNMLASCPFDTRKLKDKEMIYFVMLKQPPGKENVKSLLHITDPVDEIAIIKQTVYLNCKRGFSKTVFNNNFIEKLLHVKATTRNLNTVKKMLALAG